MWLLAALFPLTMLPFATVHEVPRAALTVASALLGGGAIWRGAARRRPSAQVATLLLGGALAVLISALPLLSVGPETRRALQPALASVVGSALALSGVDHAPLALDPRGALLDLSGTAGALLLAAGVGMAARDGRRVAVLDGVLVGGGVGLVLVAALHRFTGAESIWWVSGVPSFSRAPFMGPFVNPNHGGLACAMLLPLAAASALSRRTWSRATGAVALAVLLVGVRLSGSRGALLAAGVAGLVMLGLLGGARARRLVLAAPLVALITVLIWGPEAVGLALSEWLVPEALAPGEDLYTGRGEVQVEVMALVAGAPLLGVGAAGFDDGFQVVKTSPSFSRIEHAHQELLQIAAEHGLPVLVVWALVVGIVAVHAALRSQDTTLSGSRRRRLAAHVASGAALLTACTITFPLRIGALEVLAALILGGAVGLGGSGEGGRFASASLLRAVGAALAVSALSMQAVAWSARDHDSSPRGSADAAVARGLAAWGEDKRSPERAAEASAWFRLAVRRQPLRREPLQLLGRSLEAEGRPDEAQRALMVATRVYPSLPWPHVDLARLLRRRGDVPGFRAAMRAALACDLPEGRDEELVREVLAGPGSALQALRQGLPLRADRLAVAGAVLEDRGEPVAAMVALGRAASLDARYGAHLGAALLKRERPAEALRAARIVSPPSCYSRRVELRALLALHGLEEALGLLPLAQRLCGEAYGRELRLLGAELRLAGGDPRGIEVIETLLREEPEDHALRRRLAEELRARGWDEQLATQLKALERAGRATPAERRELEQLRARGAGVH